MTKSRTSQSGTNTSNSIVFERLLVRPKWQKNEGKLGYLKRVATENDLAPLMLGEIDFTGDADFHAHDSSLKILPMSSWNIRFSRFCPHCLGTEPIWKCEWELLFFDACPIHRCWLIDTCPECSIQFTWKRKHLLTCDCGAQLKNMTVASCSPHILQLVNAIKKDVVGVTRTSSSSHFNGLTTAQIQRVVRLFGSVGDFSGNVRSQKIAHVDRLDISRQLTSVTAEILANWPTAFHMLLSTLEQKNRRSMYSHRLPKCFGILYANIFDVLQEEGYDFLRKAFNEFVLANWAAPIGKRNTRIPENQRMHGAWLPSSHACRELGVSSRRLRKMIADELLIGETRVHPASGRSYTIVQREQLNSSKRHIDDFVDLQTAAALVGLSKKRIVQLRSLLFPHAKKTLAVHNAPWMIDLADIDRILHVGSTIPERGSTTAGEITFGHVIRYWIWSDADIADFIWDCINGMICPKSLCTGKRGVCSWVFSDQELREWISRRNDSGKSDMSVPEVAQYIGIKQEVAYFLVRNDWISSVIIDKQRGTEKRVSYRSVDDFLNLYVFLAELAKKNKSSSRWLLSRLANMGIHPVSGPHIDGGRQLIMRRDKQLELAIIKISQEPPMNPRN